MEGSISLSQTRKNERIWHGLKSGGWCNSIDVRGFIVENVTPYLGDETFLVPISRRSSAVWEKLAALLPTRAEEGSSGS